MKVQLIILSIVLVASVQSCTDYLDVRPENQMLLDDYWKKESDVEAVLLSCYRAMQESEYMRRVILWGELRSDNVIADASASDNLRQIHLVNIMPTNAECRWESVYKVINYCNVVLKYAPQVRDSDPDFTESDLRAKLAEALAIRALSYFYLVRTFGAVPLSLEATISDDQELTLPQSSPDVVLNLLVSDLQQAEQWAMETYLTDRESKGRMTKDAIRSVLADLLLWKKDYSNCVLYCDKLLNAKKLEPVRGGIIQQVGKYELIEEEANNIIFGIGNSQESIFELQFSSNVIDNSSIGGLYGTSSAIGQLAATAFYVETDVLYAATDIRKNDFIISTKTGTGAYQIFKYLGQRSSLGASNFYSFRMNSANWIFYRISDIMLLKAEALVQLGDEASLRAALHLVNKTFMRANPTRLKSDTLVFENYSSKEAMDKLVLAERHRELMFEGKRWFDLVRYAERKNSTAELVESVLTKYSSDQSAIMTKLAVMNALYLPIHADELKVNPLLKQNPYYESSTNIVK
ncbi:MAG: hypothetical protein BGP01_00780 [Paludibacter sp. 47-17]|nr:MAG: hypothetical protein BGP01_00780 [Paludibacter sp. 47-17]